MADELEDITIPDQGVLQVPSLRFDPDRIGNMLHNICLYTVYHLQKWNWNTVGVSSFLDATARHRLASSSYGSYFEHLERISDDAMQLSPHADNAVVHLRIA
eukprot:s19_g50.t1